MKTAQRLGLVAAAAAGLLLAAGARETIRRWTAPGAAAPGTTRVAIVLAAPGEGRESVLQTLTIPAEQALRGWSAVRSVRSLTEAGEVRLDILADVDADAALLGARRRLGAIEGGATLQSMIADPNSPAVLDVAIVGGDVAAASTLALATLAPTLRAIDGVTRVEIFGAVRLGVAVEPRAADLMAHDITPGELAARLCALGAERDAGRLRDGAALRPVVVRERIRTLGELAAVQIPAGDAGSRRSVLLADLARLDVTGSDDGSDFRVGSEAAVLLRIFGAPRVSSRSIAALARVSVPQSLRVITRPADRSAELAFETLSRTASRDTAAEALGALPPETAGAAWSLWVFDARRHSAIYAADSQAASRWRGRLWLASATARDSATGSLAQRGLRARRVDAGQVLWLSAPDGLRLRALAARARGAEARAASMELVDSPPPARRVLRLRPELGAAERAAIESALDAAFGRRECGQIEIPGIAGTIELLATAVPRPELLPVRPFLDRSAVPLGAVGDLSAAPASDETTIERWDGWPALRLSFAQPDAAERIARALALGPVERAWVEPSGMVD